MTRPPDHPGGEIDRDGAASGGREFPLRAPRLPWWRFLAVAAGAAAVTTVVAVYVSVQLTPPCGGPWCLTGLLYFPISAVGAAVVALAIARYARRGARGYLAGFLVGAAGYGAAWLYLLGDGRLRFIP